MTDEEFRKLCNTFGFAPSRALRELIDCVRAQEIEACAKVCDNIADHDETIGDALAEPVQEPVCAHGVGKTKCSFCSVEDKQPMQEPKPVEFDHGIGADRFKVVRGAFWWHVLIGDSPTEHGKFRSRASAEKMAADLLREFRNGAFVQHEAALAEPVQEPLGWAVQVGTHGAGRRRDKPRYTIFFDKAAAENLAYRTGTHPKPFYIGGNDD